MNSKSMRHCTISFIQLYNESVNMMGKEEVFPMG